jgi:hypothetical protein
MVQRDFPEVRLVTCEKSGGYILRRNEAAKLAKGAVIFSIDDDAVFSSPRTVEQTISEFDLPNVGAVAIPCLDVNRYWTLTKGGTWTFTSYAPTFNFVATDVDPGANFNNFIVQRFSAGWTTQTIGTTNRRRHNCQRQPPTSQTASGRHLTIISSGLFSLGVCSAPSCCNNAMLRSNDTPSTMNRCHVHWLVLTVNTSKIETFPSQHVCKSS